MNLKELFAQEHASEVALTVLFCIYLIMGSPIPGPEGIAHAIDSTLGKIIILLAALMMFAYTNPVLGVLSLLVAYQIIKSASIKSGTAGLEEYYPSEVKKWTPFPATHQFPYTLEQEIVKNMTTQKFNAEYVKAPFRPTLDDTHDASPLI